MSSGGASAVRNTLIAMISRECRHFQDGVVFTASNLTEIPPFGTCDYDGNPTSVTDSGPTTGGVNYPKTAAFAACHQFIGGKTSMSVNFGGETFDVVDLNDTVIPRQHFRGPRNYSGNLELWDGDIDLTLWLSTILGGWDPAQRSAEDFPDLRHFEFYILVDPLDANQRRALNLTATQAAKFIRLYNITFPSADLKMENPLKVTVPFNFSRVKLWSNWTQPSQATLIPTTTLPIVGNGDTMGTNSNKVWTRLNLNLDGTTALSADDVVTFTGSDPLGNAINESLPVLSSGSFPTVLQTKSVFSGAFVVTPGANFTAGDYTVTDVDYGLTPTLDAAGGVPVTN